MFDLKVFKDYPTEDLRSQFLAKLTEVLSSFKDNETSLSVKISFQDVGPLEGDTETLYWDENSYMFMDDDPTAFEDE